MHKRLWMAGLLLSSTPAFAFTDVYESPVVTSGSVVGGLGVGGFTSALGSTSSAGIGWELRGEVVFRRFFGLEASYQGLSSPLNTANTGTVIVPVRTQFTLSEISADFVPGVSIMVGDHILRPYAVAGVGYAHVGVNNAPVGVVGGTGVDAAAFPLGAGISLRITSEILLDARYTYNLLGESEGNTWNAGFNVGGAFGGP
jgi:opacity protein-like surface antigen